MCKEWFNNLFKEKVVLKLPHPEEPVNVNCTMQNYNIDLIFQKWFEDYQVPFAYQFYWRNQIEIEVTDNIPYPAATWGTPSGRHLAIRPMYLNAGVLAHEQAHNSFALLTISEQMEFIDLHTQLKKDNMMVKFLYSVNPYGLSNSVEGHAELYRYLGETMPQELKRFYPKLFVV
ncbi:MAG: hypothetical protein PHS93_08905 [Candidatus Omnitrophica bacterium]|nr:hypothetical protein [Candidatus Omnitrophota bacterium]